MNYRGIIVKEGLENPTVLENVKILSIKTWDYSHDTTWHTHKVEIPEEQIHTFTKALAENISPNGLWYAHFYHENPRKSNAIVVFYKKRFLLSKDNFERAMQYGLAEGFPAEQLDFKPMDVKHETW